MTDTGFPTLQVELDAAMKLINDEWVQLAGQIEKAGGPLGLLAFFCTAAFIVNGFAWLGPNVIVGN